jgi:hypothetical protein
MSLREIWQNDSSNSRRALLTRTVEGTRRRQKHRLAAGWQRLGGRQSPGSKSCISRRDFAAKNSIVLKELRESDLCRVVLRCDLCQPATPRILQKESDQLIAIFTSGMKKLHPIPPSSKF